MVVEAENMCGTLPSLPRMSLERTAYERTWTVLSSLYVNVVETVGSFS